MIEVSSVFLAAAKQVFLVGGAVRDILRRGKAHDWDLATDAHPEEVIQLFSDINRGKKAKKGSDNFRCFVIPTGIKHGTVTLHYKDLKLEVTTFRSDGVYSNGRHPDNVEFGVSIEEDLSRRDFTMNAAAYKLPKGPLVDPFNGREDIKRRLIRCVGKPEERFNEDGLRPMRALRFASQLNFAVDGNLLEAIPAALPLTGMVAVERIRDEIDKILLTDKPSIAFKLMEETGLLRQLIPELAACRGVRQDKKNGMHLFDVLDHSLLCCDYTARDNGHDKSSLALCLASLYHDIGKSITAKLNEDGEWTFHKHESESSEIARKILLRFRYPNSVIDKCCHLIKEHMFSYDANYSDAAVRRFIIRVGEENLKDLFSLRRADAYATAAKEMKHDNLLPLIKHIEKVMEQSRAFTIKDLSIGGKDLIMEGILPGKHMGIILEELLEAVIEDPELNKREKLLEIAGNINKRYI